jgi:hypothetical protein
MSSSVQCRPLDVTSSRLWCRISLRGPGGRELGSWSLRGVGSPDLGTVDRLARAQLAAVRRDSTLVLSDVSDDLGALLELVGLRREAGGQTELREDVLDVEERVEPADPTV